MQTSIWLDGMMGLVVGDALGVPVEFMTKEEIRSSPQGLVTGMRGHGTFDMPSGTWSDDSSMALATLNSLNLQKGIDPDHIMQMFVYWQENGDFTPFHKTFDEGYTCRSAINAYIKDRDTKTCGVTGEYANGNGALMRILPVCLFVYEKVKAGKMTEEEAVAQVHKIAALTHNHLRSNMCCGVYFFLVQSILDNKGQGKASLTDILQQGMDKAHAFYSRDHENATEMAVLKRIWNLRDFRNTPEEAIKSSGYVIHTIEAALWCLLRANSYRDATLSAVNLGHDTDTTAAVTGGLAGLFYGYNNIPEEWRTGIRALDDTLNPCELMAGTKFRYGYSAQPYREELLRRLQRKHRRTTMELLNSIARLEIEKIDGQYEFVKYYDLFGKTASLPLHYETTGQVLEILVNSIGDELIRRNPVVETYPVRHSDVTDKGGWHLERYEINKHATGDYSLFQQAGDRVCGGSRWDMIHPDAFLEKDYSEFLKWVPHCGISHKELLADTGLKAFFGY